MVSPSCKGYPHGRNRLERVTLVVWIVVVAVISWRSFAWPHIHSVFPIYVTAARNWQAGQDLYAPQPHVFDLYRYSPTVAVLLVPLSQLPDNLGSVLWRLLNLAAFGGGLAWWAQAVLPGSALSRRQWALLALLLLPLSLESLNNGQVNPLLSGLTLGTVAAAASERWNLAAAGAALLGLLKVYPLALGLLLVLVYPRRFGPRWLAALALGLAAPFLCQDFDYVMQQYRTWLELLGGDDRSNWPLRIAPQDLYMLFRVASVPLSGGTYLVLRLVLAGGVAAMCLLGRSRLISKRLLLTALSTQVCCWMILCGPNSEPCTYILLAPVLAWVVVDAWQPGRTALVRCSATAVLVVMWLPFLGRLLSGGNDNLAGLMPLGAILLWSHLLPTQLSSLWGSRRLALPRSRWRPCAATPGQNPLVAAESLVS